MKCFHVSWWIIFTCFSLFFINTFFISFVTSFYSVLFAYLFKYLVERLTRVRSVWVWWRFCKVFFGTFGDVISQLANGALVGNNNFSSLKESILSIAEIIYFILELEKGWGGVQRILLPGKKGILSSKIFLPG